MKRILIALAVLASVQVAGAQNIETAKKNLEAAKAACENVKKAAKVATWINLGNKFIDAYNAPIGNAWVGADVTSLTLAMGNDKPVSTENVVLNGTTYTKQVYKDKNIYINEAGVVDIIEVTNPVCADPLSSALEAFVKAAEVDVKATKLKDIANGIKSVSEKYVTDAYSAYSLGNIESARDLFVAAYNASLTQPYAVADTSALYNAAFTSWSIGDNADAKDYFEKCISLNYFEDGEVYTKLADVMSKLDTTAAGKKAMKSVLEEGFSKFPSNQGILIGLINYYITSGEDTDRLFSLLDDAKKNEPGNASLYYVEGNIYLQLGNAEKAKEAYRKCSEINPEYEWGYIGEGMMYYDQAIEIQDKAQSELDDAKYMELVKEFEVVLKNCLAPFEKAFEITKDESIKMTVAEYLKNANYRFSSQDPSYKEAYDKYNAYLNQ
ncbi:MAG: tetratricopeptide repeat protein [Bacteroidales bacterium]|uniref:tetratricopeptide repeat protein n=1 Tax=Candidatus Cryptobacteroides sp. TaxID=2952915 RepID=UPI002A8011F3|nr:tetratricopeptide repeat protein [Candidatus Cryptobacteroides sp.]MDD7135955.1 tetratricopeptide repeat protein [Bacteroidales bacterium]MDY3878080.1 tetratricopeptide repeat protein [Candidatus Cryptobacteroides sp.]MDY5565671.1 tetratricopeptide repeat protein [Candidatus Cryptobacteroides sp.]